MNNAILKFKLTNFFGAFVKEVEGLDGEMEECVCIPLEKNNLKKGNNNAVNAYCFVNKTNVVGLDGWTHYLQLKLASYFVEKMRNLGYKKMPYMGNMKANNYIVYNDTYKQKFVNVKDYE